MKKLLFLLLSTCSFALLAGPSSAQQLPAPVTDQAFVETDKREVAVGQLLFWDPILSGNKNIACGTCHHPKFGTGDGVSLSLGEGGFGLGPDRAADPNNLPEQRIPRNAPALFNLGAKEFVTMFHDGRLQADPTKKSGIRTPLDDDMTVGFSGVLSAQSMFPVLSPDEMAGHYNENDVAQAVRRGVITGQGGAWDIIAKRVSSIAEYQEMFAGFDAEIAAGRPIDFTDISDALAAFIAFEWRSDDSPFDAHLRGQTKLSGQAAVGLDLFYGKAECASCHTGPFQTDHGFHAMGAPQLGPGKAARFESHSQDTGRMRVTGKPGDAYKFRTPSLRNVALTAPYGHAGAHHDLADFLRAHIQPKEAIFTYAKSNAILPKFEPVKNDWAVLDDDQERLLIADAITATNIDLADDQLKALVAFLETLTDQKSADGRLGIPASVPSGLPIDR